MVTCKFFFFFNFVEKNSFTFKKITSVAKMASTVYETESCDGDTELVRAVDVVKEQAKRIYILIIKVNKLFSFFLVVVFSKRNRKHLLRVSIELYKHS